MTPRSIRRAQERRTQKAANREAKNTAAADSTLSEAKLAANRANAQLSTGPKSEEGRAKVSLNAVKTALTGRTVLLPSDQAAEYERHVQGFASLYSPVGQREAELVQSIADSWWRLKRIPCLESALLAQGYLECAEAFPDHDESIRPSLIEAQAFLRYEKQIRNLQLQEARLFRRYEKERTELQQLQHDREQREFEALQLAASAYQNARANDCPYDNRALGFEFSNEQLEEYLAVTESRQQAYDRSQNTHAQAA